MGRKEKEEKSRNGGETKKPDKIRTESGGVLDHAREMSGLNG